MRVFVTGSTGFIGSAVVKDLLAAGHSVVGLARSDKGVEQLQAQGVEAVRGTLEDLPLLEATAAASDTVLHLAFIHDIARFAEGFADVCAVDRAAIAALGKGLVRAGGGPSRALVATSGTMLVSQGGRGTVYDETSPVSTASPLAKARGPSEQVCLDFAKPENGGLRASVVRLPPVVHGAGGFSGFASHLARLAWKAGKAAYAGDGLNRWSAVHKDDAAVLYRLAAEKGTPGAVYNGVGEQGVVVKALTEAVGKELGVPVAGLAADSDDAAAYFGALLRTFMTDNIVSSAATQRQLGWAPTAMPLLADVPVIVGHITAVFGKEK